MIFTVGPASQGRNRKIYLNSQTWLASFLYVLHYLLYRKTKFGLAYCCCFWRLLSFWKKKGSHKPSGIKPPTVVTCRNTTRFSYDPSYFPLRKSRLRLRHPETPKIKQLYAKSIHVLYLLVSQTIEENKLLSGTKAVESWEKKDLKQCRCSIFKME